MFKINRRFGFSKQMRKLLPYLLILFVILFSWYYKGMPQKLKKGFGRLLAVLIVVLWVYVLLKYF